MSLEAPGACGFVDVSGGPQLSSVLGDDQLLACVERQFGQTVESRVVAVCLIRVQGVARADSICSVEGRSVKLDETETSMNSIMFGQDCRGATSYKGKEELTLSLRPSTHGGAVGAKKQLLRRENRRVEISVSDGWSEENECLAFS